MSFRNSQSTDQNYSGENPDFDVSLSKRYTFDKVFEILAWSATLFALSVLAILLFNVLTDGLARLNWSFITSYPSRRPDIAGILSPLVGSIWLLVTIAIVSFPLGVGAGIYLEEYAKDTWLTRFVEINIANLAAVPSIIYGLLGLQVFVRWMAPLTNGRSVLAGALTLSLLILPIIIITTRESLRAVPDSLRQAGYALGATKWQVIRVQIFPIALPGILTGTILALSRAIGETAPLITIGALTFIAFVPDLSLKGLQSPFTALPIQIYNWVSRPQPEFHNNAAAAIIVLMLLLLLMNTSAILLRNKFQQSRR
ncbi:phosphate ABC transporter permease PstA [Cylindrospermum sp. FACHB-282]|uniref:phosphate ABC transporter permease PstA n=1 Tax=Cylindrospermum sp. FACHB-282 TaxID=2692794 RepID=UPI0016889DCC|nr:phosphate ABC transporter permease PstA [Cylindrospermum sp. FACHB-282]MBD2385031.1 phosphate ABC transporter permease PstA [Cylindrospermum sp. FACHB-282]